MLVLMIHRRVMALLLLFLASVPPFLGAKPLVIRITADIQGYLVGCDCPDGPSAGLSAVAADLESRPGGLLLDAGGFREPERSDPLLERFLDRAAGQLEYDGMVADEADFRDGTRVLRRRVRGGLPLSAVGRDSEFLGRWSAYPGRRKARLIASPDGIVAVSDIASVELLAAETADFRIAVSRGPVNGGLEIGFVDLVVVTGRDSPAAALPEGGIVGTIDSEGRSVPWLSLAPRGNGWAEVRVPERGDPQIVIHSLRRGESPDDPEILALGDAFMDALVGQALSAAGGGRESAVRAAEPSVIQTTYWYPFGCRDCEDFLWNTIPELEWTSGSTINVAERDTRDPADFEALLTELERRDVRLRSVPVMIVGDAIFQGYDEIESGLRSVAEGGIAAQSDSNRGPVSWEPGAIALAGLLDGVNPCAFSAMVFLVSALAVAGRTRRVLMAIGLSYSLGVFATYFLIGAGLLGGLRNLVVQSDLRRILETALAIMLLILAGLSVIDGVKLSRGRTDLLLKLPDSLSKRVHGIIRRSIRSGAAVGGSLLLGALVALIELGCTGQVYLPTIAWMISRGEEGRPWLWLLIYNSAFIIPLLAVFVISYRGVSAIRLAGAFKKRGAAVKYATAGLFAVLAAVVFVA